MARTDPRANDPARWQGSNLLGKAWMRVRDEVGGRVKRQHT